MKAILLALLVLLSAVRAEATTYYVSLSGNDSNSCVTAQSTTQANQKLTIAAGVACAFAGDTVYIHGGTYTGSDARIDSQVKTVRSGTSYSNAITIASYPGETAILQPPSNIHAVRLTTDIGYIIILDIWIDMINSQAGGTAEGVIYYTAHHIRFQRMNLYNSGGFGFHNGGSPFTEVLDSKIHDIGDPGATAITAGHCIYHTADDGLYQNNEVYNCQGYGIHLWNGYGPHVTPSNNIIERNRIHHVGLNGFEAYGVTVTYGSNNIVRNNLVYSNPGGIQGYSYTSGTKFYHNTLYGNGVYGAFNFQFYDAGAAVERNLLWNNYVNYVDNGTTNSPGTPPSFSGNVTTNPGFTNAAAGDFTIAGGSSAVDTGSCASGVSVDFIGTPRPQGASCDAGAYEVASGSHTPTTYYVSLSGSDSNSCSTAQSTTQSNQRLTIAAGVACAVGGDTVYIHGGTYTGVGAVIDSQTYTVGSGSSFASAILISAVASETVTLRPPASVSAVRLTTGSPHHLIIQDLTLDMVNSTDTALAAVVLNTSHHIRLQRLVVENGYGYGVSISTLTYSNEVLDSVVRNIGDPGGAAGTAFGSAFKVIGSDNLFDGNTVYNNYGYAFQLYTGTGSHADPSRNIIRANRIYNNCRHGGAIHAILVAWGDANLVYNNLIYSNVAGGVSLYTYGSNTLLANNTIYGNTGNGIETQYYDAGVIARNNIVYGNGGAIVDNGTGLGVSVTFDHNLTTDPFVTNAATGDFTLTALSVGAVNAGTTVATVTDDFNGTARPISSVYDIGAYEYSPSVPVITVEPISQTIASGATAALSVAATGTPTLTYQWYVGASGTTTSPISGATSSSYTTAALTMTTSYWVRVSNGAGSDDSATATISISNIAAPRSLRLVGD